MKPRRITFVMGTTAGGTGAHVRMLATRLASQGTAVTVAGPAAAGERFGFGALPQVRFVPVEFGDRPRPGDIRALRRLRRMVSVAGLAARLGPAASAAGHGGAPAGGDIPDVVDAHGLRAGALTALALTATRRAVRPALVVTVHNAPPSGGAVRALVYRVLERIVARRADLVLCVSRDLKWRMAAAGARRVGLAIVPAAAQARPDVAKRPSSLPGRLLAARAAGRPVVLAVGRLAPQKGFGTLLSAASSWRGMDPAPQLVIVGDGPLGADLRARSNALGVDAEFLGYRDDVPALLATASVFVLPSLWEGQPLVLQEALHAGAVIVASRTGGIPDLVGDAELAGDRDLAGDLEPAADAAALLVPPGDAAALATAVRSVLTDPGLAARLKAAARRRAAALPTEDDAMRSALAAYATLAR